MAIIINFTKQSSEQDMEDLRILLEDIRSRYHFNWFVQGQETGEKPESGQAGLRHEAPDTNTESEIEKELNKNYEN